MVKDATASSSDEEMHAALDVNIPNYASAIVTTNEVVGLISSSLGCSYIAAQRAKLVQRENGKRV